MSVTVDLAKAVEIVEKPTDNRGRVTLGSKYANKNLKLIIIEKN